jgi:Flp pilus assembly protein TadB
MTQQEIEDELKSLRELRKKWHSLGKAAAVLAIVFVLCAIGLLVFSIAYPGTRYEMHQAAVLFVLLGLPYAFLGSALR